MGRRRNGAGTLYRRGNVFYAQIKVADRVLRLSTGETDKRRALARLNTLAKGYDLSDEERLAAVSAALRPHEKTILFDSALEEYLASPARPTGNRKVENRSVAWARLRRWAKGYTDKNGVEFPAACPRLRLLTDVTESVVARFMTYLRGRYAPLTINNTVSELSMIWKGLKLEHNPWRDIQPERGGCVARYALTDDELRLVMSRAKGEMRTLLFIGAYTGLRISDAARLRWEDITPDMGMIALRPRKTASSSGITVAIPVHPALKAALGEHGGTGYVMPLFANRRPRQSSKLVTMFFKRCGLVTTEKRDGYFNPVCVRGFHSLRATFVSRLANSGMPLAMIQSMVGHVSPQMTLHYYRADANAARPLLERLPAIA